MFSMFSSKKDEPRGRFYQDKTLIETAKLIADLYKKEKELSTVVKDKSKDIPFELVRKQLLLEGFLEQTIQHIRVYNDEREQPQLEVAAHLLLAVTELLNNHFDELNYFRSSSKAVVDTIRSYGAYALGFGTAALVTSSTLGFGLLGFIGARYLDGKSEKMLGYDIAKTATVEELILLMNNLVKVVKFYQAQPGQTVKAKKLANKAIKSLQGKQKGNADGDELTSEIEEAITKITPDVDHFLQFLESTYPKEEYEYLYCPVSLAIMTDPVTLGTTGHTFQREQVVMALAEQPHRDPLSNEQIGNNKIATNYLAKEIIIKHINDAKEAFLAQQADRDLTEGSESEFEDAEFGAYSP